jgi:hypothetical protein
VYYYTCKTIERYQNNRQLNNLVIVFAGPQQEETVPLHELHDNNENEANGNGNGNGNGNANGAAASPNRSPG